MKRPARLAGLGSSGSELPAIQNYLLDGWLRRKKSASGGAVLPALIVE